MTPSRVAALIAARGETLSLRRLAGTQQIPFEVQLKGVVRDYRPDELAGAITQGDRQAFIGNTEILARQWPGPPKSGDKLVRSGKTLNVEGVETRKIGEDDALHVLRVRG